MVVWHGSFACAVAQGPRIIYTCMGWERESYERSSCFMRERHGRARGACGQLGLEGEVQGEGHGEKRRARGCSELLTSPGE